MNVEELRDIFEQYISALNMSKNDLNIHMSNELISISIKDNVKIIEQKTTNLKDIVDDIKLICHICSDENGTIELCTMCNMSLCFECYVNKIITSCGTTICCQTSMIELSKSEMVPVIMDTIKKYNINLDNSRFKKEHFVIKIACEIYKLLSDEIRTQYLIHDPFMWLGNQSTMRKLHNRRKYNEKNVQDYMNYMYNFFPLGFDVIINELYILQYKMTTKDLYAIWIVLTFIPEFQYEFLPSSSMK